MSESSVEHEAVVSVRPLPARSQPGRRRVIVHAIFAAVGLAAMGMLVRSVGPAALLAAMKASAKWLPLIAVLELGRVATEVWATLSLSDRVRRVPLGELVRVHLLGYAVAGVMPAGRATGETVKAALLARFLGAPEAAAIGATNQSSAMLGGALAGAICAAAALALTGASAFTGALIAFTLVSLAVVTAFQIACRRPGLGGALLARFTKREDTPRAFQAAIGRIPVAPAIATFAALLSRVLFAAEIAVLLHATAGAAGLGQTVLAMGASLVGGAFGDMVPGQLGASDGAFALAAPVLGITAADGVAIAMTLHVVQLAWGIAGWTIPLAWKAAPAPAEAGARA